MQQPNRLAWSAVVASLLMQPVPCVIEDPETLREMPCTRVGRRRRPTTSRGRAGQTQVPANPGGMVSGCPQPMAMAAREGGRPAWPSAEDGC